METNVVVSIHARTGRATARRGRKRAATWRFNSRAHGARDLSCCRKSARSSGFNSRAHGARDGGGRGGGASGVVSIHARTGRATPCRVFPPPHFWFQFTRARGARPARQQDGDGRDAFQFTRARGARLPRRRLPHLLRVSIHARTGRATFRRRRRWSGRFRFNSRAHGARDLPRRALNPPPHVSIHARTGRATAHPFPVLYFHQFQFTRARGARPSPPPPAQCRAMFQFTRARGARPMSLDKSVKGHRVSIHARTGRATYYD